MHSEAEKVERSTPRSDRRRIFNQRFLQESAMELTGTIQLSVESKIENVRIMGIAVRAVGSAAGFDAEEAGSLELALVEALNNVVIHAYKNEPGHAVDLRITIEPKNIRFRIDYNGQGFQPEPKQMPDFDPEDISTLPEGGMGLFIINTIMDEVKYECGKERNSILLTKRIP